MTTKEKQAKPDESFLIFLDEPDEPSDEANREDPANIVQLRRDCTIEEIDGIRQRLLSALGDTGSITIDLGAVQGVDCAFLQLLVSFLLEADARDLEVSLINRTESLMESAATLGLATALGDG